VPRRNEHNTSNCLIGSCSGSPDFSLQLVVIYRAAVMRFTSNNRFPVWCIELMCRCFVFACNRNFLDINFQSPAIRLQGTAADDTNYAQTAAAIAWPDPEWSFCSPATPLLLHTSQVVRSLHNTDIGTGKTCL